MHARIAQYALASAVFVVAACVTAHLLSTPTDAAGPASPFARIHWQQAEQTVAAETQAAITGRERPAHRPARSDFDDPAQRVRSSSLEALLQRPDRAQE
jgi:hypothetical protein